MNKEEYDVERICVNCEHSIYLENTDNCVCEKKGIVKADNSCGSYKLDLLKIKPRKAFSEA